MCPLVFVTNLWDLRSIEFVAFVRIDLTWTERVEMIGYMPLVELRDDLAAVVVVHVAHFDDAVVVYVALSLDVYALEDSSY